MTDIATVFERHLSGAEMKEIAAEEFRQMCQDYFSRIGHTVSIANVAYPIVRKAIDEALGGAVDKLIAEKAISVINDLSSYTVFHAPSAYDREPSESWKTLQRIVRENEDLLRDRIQHHIHNLSKSDALGIIKTAKLTIETGK
jgi:hypothetical protein